MLLDGRPVWWLILDRRPSPPAAMGFGGRIVALWLVMIGQILIGAIVGLAQHDLYPVYAICGRAFALTPLVDQELGGLVVWIPGAMMSVLARSEEHTSELQSLMRISYAVFCLKKKKT